jgi:RNA 2',3'-cyclic 3'-phosphodiesterase
MRLFVAVELGDDVLREAGRAIERLRERLGRALDTRWVSTEKMHLTIRFIGQVLDDRVPAVLESLAPPLAIQPFEITLAECGVFPVHGPPRVLWLGLREGVASLETMHDEFNRRLAPLGFQAEDRQFSAHVTLARIKDAPRGSGAAVRHTLRSMHVTSARGHVSEAVVFESRLSPKGSTYIDRLRVPLVH